jgi:hypothetical protein
MTMTMAADPHVYLGRKVSDRVRDEESHRLVAEALTAVALAALHPARHLGVGRTEARGMLDESIERAVHAAVETLDRRLKDLVGLLPGATVDALAREQTMAEQGIE